MKQIVIHTDGASRGNPGPSSIAYVIEIDEQKPIMFSKKTGILPNNQAEYFALKATIEELLDISPKGANIQFFSDSELMTRQLNGEYKVKNAAIAQIFHEVKNGLRRLEQDGNSWTITSIPREQNKVADKLANQALDQI